MHKQNLLARHHFLDFVSANIAARPDLFFIGILAANGLRRAIRVLCTVLILVGVAFGLYQSLAVLDRNAIVIGVNFAEGQESLPVAAIFNKGGLKRRFDARHACQINVAFELLAVFGFVIEILNTGAAQQDNPCLFGLSPVDK